MGGKRIVPRDIAVNHKDKIINLPVSLSFDAGEFLLSDIKKESIKIKEYNGSTGEIIAGGIKIGKGSVLAENSHARIKMNILRKKNLAGLLDKSRVHITCVLDTFMMPAGTIEDLGHDTIIPLKATIDGDPVSLMVNGCKMADGELCSVGDRFGIRIISLVNPDEENLVQPRTGNEPEVMCSIIAGKKEATIKELYTIGEGSVIKFDNPVSDLFSLVINGQPAFLVEILCEGENFKARIYEPDLFTKYLLPEKIHEDYKEQHIKSEDKRVSIPFHFINEPEALLFNTLFGEEHPQIIALLLSCLTPEISRIAYLSLPDELKTDVTKRISLIKKVDEKTLYHIEKYVKEKITRIRTNPSKEPGGIEHTIKILQGIIPDERKKILDVLENDNKSLADEIKKRFSEMKNPE